MSAISTYGATLMKGTTVAEVTTYEKLIDIKDFPDLGGAPEMLETTTTSDSSQTYINGIQSMSAMEFTSNYNLADYTTLKALEGTTSKYALYFGVDGANGKFGWDGQLAVWAVGAGVNAVVDMKISISPSTVIALIA